MWVKGGNQSCWWVVGFRCVKLEYLRVVAARETVAASSKEVTTPSTIGKPPWVMTGEWRPVAVVYDLAVTCGEDGGEGVGHDWRREWCPVPLKDDLAQSHTAEALAVLSPEATVQMRSPISTALAFLRIEQQVGPTGRWCVAVSYNQLPSAVHPNHFWHADPHPPLPCGNHPTFPLTGTAFTRFQSQALHRRAPVTVTLGTGTGPPRRSAAATAP